MRGKFAKSRSVKFLLSASLIGFVAQSTPVFARSSHAADPVLARLNELQAKLEQLSQDNAAIKHDNAVLKDEVEALKGAQANQLAGVQQTSQVISQLMAKAAAPTPQFADSIIWTKDQAAIPATAEARAAAGLHIGGFPVAGAQRAQCRCRVEGASFS